MAKFSVYAITRNRTCFWILLISLVVAIFYFTRNTSHTPLQKIVVKMLRADISEHKNAGSNPKPLSLGNYVTRNAQGWSLAYCDPNRKFPHVSFTSMAGNVTLYVYNSHSDDTLLSKKIGEKGLHSEKREINKFLSLSRHLPLIDIGANLGLVTLQAALQGRQVVAVEPIPKNALRLCRSVVDFGHASLVHVIQNAVSSKDGNVTLAIGVKANARTYYEVSRGKGWGHDATTVYAIRLDRLLDVLPFKRAALKIDVESHEGHVLAGAEQLFQEIDIPLVWMEWEDVKGRRQYGGNYIIQFMKRHHMVPYHLLTGKLLSVDKFLKWPFTVLWLRSVPSMQSG